jgi:hypothetical protein
MVEGARPVSPFREPLPDRTPVRVGHPKPYCKRLGPLIAG